MTSKKIQIVKRFTSFTILQLIRNALNTAMRSLIPWCQITIVPPGLKPGFVRRILIVHLTAGNKNMTPINVMRGYKSDN